MANAKEAPTLVTASAAENAKNNGTIHVRVLSGRSLPVHDFARRQEPIVLVELDGSSPKSWGTTDPAFTGGNSPEWTADQNREVELFYDDALQAHEAVLTFLVYSDETLEEMVGTGQLNVSKLVKAKTEGPTDFTVRLKEARDSANARGEISVQVWFGPPVRKAFRAAQRVSKLLDMRDHVVAAVWSLGLSAGSPFAKYLSGPADFLKKNRKISAALAALLGVIAACATGLFMVVAVPTAAIAAFTFPFWIIPFLLVSFFTAPLWIPVLLLVGVFLAFTGAFFVGLGITSRPVRRKGALLTSRIKHSDVGKRVVYEKTE